MKENDKDSEETSTAIKNQNSKYIKVRARILIIFGIISIFTFFALQNSKMLFSGSIYSTDGEYHYEMKADPFIPQSVLLVLGLFDIFFGILALIKSHHSRLKLISIWIMLRAILFTIMALKTFRRPGDGCQKAELVDE